MTSTSQREPEVWRGGAALPSLDRFRREAGCRSVVLVVDAAVAANGYGARVEEAVDGVEVLVQVLPPGEPSVASVDAAAAPARALDQPLVVGVGGGSAVDTAKQVAIVLGGSAGVGHYVLARHPITGRRPIVAIPTTSGTVAEVTRTSVLTDAERRARRAGGPRRRRLAGAPESAARSFTAVAAATSAARSAMNVGRGVA